MGNESNTNIVKRYEIDSKVYEQRKMTLFQMTRIIDQVGSDSFQRMGNGDFASLAGRLPILLAIIFNESGTTPGQKEKNIEELALDLDMNLGLEMMLDIMADLLEINDFGAIMGKATNLMAAFRKQLQN